MLSVVLAFAQGFLAEKDDQIGELHEQVREMQERLVAANMDTEKASVSALSRALEDRDRQIETLQRRLQDAAGDFQVDADLMEEVRHELQKGSKKTAHPDV